MLENAMSAREGRNIIEAGGRAAGARGPRQFPIRETLNVEGSGSLATRIVEAAKARFADWEHQPAPQHWEGLEALAKSIEDMAEGKAAPNYYYSSLPVGMGKTTILLEAIRILTSDPLYADVGIAVFTSRLEEIQRMIDDLPELDHANSKQRRFAVMIGKSAKNKKLTRRGRGYVNKNREWVSDHQNAQVLFATQAKLLAVSSSKFHKDYETFWKFYGVPRVVRVWDEAIEPAKPLIVRPQDILELADAMTDTKSAGMLRDLVSDILKAAKAGEKIFSLPELPEMPWLPYRDQDDTASMLYRMSGKQVRLFQDPDGTDVLRGTLIAYRELLPKNLAPMLILDASGDLRVTYKAWQEGRGGLVRLPSEPKTYRNLTIHHWDSAAGKEFYRIESNRMELAKAAVAAFNALPPRGQVLIIHRKADKTYKLDLIAEVKRQIAEQSGDASRIEALTWGWHTATNRFANVRHVIVLGLHQYNIATNEAYWRAASGASAEAEVSRLQVEELRLSEIAHHLFQGVGRGSIRKTIQGDVPEGCTLHVVFCTTGKLGIPAGVLGKCFPGASMLAWEPFGTQLRTARLKTDNRPALMAKLLKMVREQEHASFEVRDLVGDGLSYQTAARLMKDAHIRRALAEQGIVVDSRTEKVDRKQEGEDRGRATVATVYTLRRDVEGDGPAQVASSIS